MDEVLYQKYEEIISIPRKMLLYLGINLNGNNGGSKSPFVENVRKLWFAIILLHCSFGALGSLIWLWLELRSDVEMDLLPLTAQLMCTVYLAIGLFVMIYIFNNSHRFAITLNELSETFREHCKAAEEHSQIATYLDSSRRQVRSFLIINYATVVLFYLIPLIMLALGMLEPKDMMTKPPFRVWVPFDSDKYYQVIYLSLFCWGLEAIHVVVMNIILLCLMISQLCLHFKYTAYQFKTIRNRVGKFDKDVSELISVFKALAKEYLRLLDLSADVSNLFSLFLLGNYIFNSFIICLIGFQIAYNSNIAETIPFITFALCILVQTLFLSYYGSQISEQVGGRCFWR